MKEVPLVSGTFLTMSNIFTPPTYSWLTSVRAKEIYLKRCLPEKKWNFSDKVLYFGPHPPSPD